MSAKKTRKTAAKSAAASAKPAKTVSAPLQIVDPIDVDAARSAALRSAAARVAGIAASTMLTPEERTERARLAGIASGAARRRRRFARENGLEPEPLRPGTKRGRAQPLPSRAVLDPWMEKLDELYPDANWTYAQRRSQAAVLLREHAAKRAAEAFE